MPTIHYDGERLECDRGEILRDALLNAGLSPHNGAATRLNCGGRATCGTCAVRIDGDVSEPSAAERRRLGIPPLRGQDDLRLSCQTEVLGDVDVRKGDGLWGQRERVEEPRGSIESDERTDTPDSTQ
ncbi:2Fe-2S iron-sulfur cluster-binding protein [Natrarchaeobius chitinivorans]|uniref:(2Fe-2S)-binding protein n=1 Tax=Natrarchaeobius chitinivorans TaxID=1679083 RepID=A0A3N6PCR3_NATCH|nr:2Fe-2S iron-sulfur cluster-binding protein [Natrarchaeobius chitinivorans]RQG94635.1 (2Fe-2S)-binding protein [Natrarchaeobius chitinivorans]